MINTTSHPRISTPIPRATGCMYLYPLAAASLDRAKQFIVFLQGPPEVDKPHNPKDDGRASLTVCWANFAPNVRDRAPLTVGRCNRSNRKRVSDLRAVARNNGRLHSYRVSLVSAPEPPLYRVARRAMPELLSRNAPSTGRPRLRMANMSGQC